MEWHHFIQEACDKKSWPTDERSSHKLQCMTMGLTITTQFSISPKWHTQNRVVQVLYTFTIQTLYVCKMTFAICSLDLAHTTRSVFFFLLFFFFWIRYNTLMTLDTQSNSIMHGCTWTSVLFSPINDGQVVVYFGSLLGHSRIERRETTTCQHHLQHKGFQRPRVGLCTSKKA